MNNTVWLAKTALVTEFFNIMARGGQPETYADDVVYNAGEKVDKEKQAEQGVGIVEIHGPIFNRAHLLDPMSGGGISPQSISSDIIEMADTNDIAEINLSIDSGGGESTNIDESADAIRYASSKKRVTTVANGWMASAAYWLGSQANTVLATVGSDIGSIGAVIAHADFSKALEEKGIDLKIYRTGSEKALGQNVDPNDERMDSSTSALLTNVLDLFVSDVAKARGFEKQYVLDKFALDKEGSLRGNTVLGAKALELGLIDGITTFQGAINESVNRVAQAHSHKKTYLIDRKVPVTKKAGNMETVLASLGLNEGSTEEDVLAAIAEQTSTKVGIERTKLLTKIGVAPDVSDEKVDGYLTTLKAQAKDGDQYRADMLEKLASLTIATEGNDEVGQATAERMKKIFSSADIADIRAEVERLEAKKDNLVPSGRLSEDTEEPTKKVKPDYDSV